MLNPTLHSLKNAIDYERTRKTSLKIEQDHDSIKISVTDSRGMEKENSNEYLNLVSPLKKKRLGLGLSLTKGL
jgi:sensor histidine kinase regulating citrate/malate metabolism